MHVFGLKMKNIVFLFLKIHFLTLVAINWQECMFYVPECHIKISLNFGHNFFVFKIKCDFLRQLIIFNDIFLF